MKSRPSGRNVRPENGGVKQLTAELQGLKEIQGNQVHPQNLVVVKKSATPMYARAAESSRVLFQAAVNDEFEFLDGNTEWIHVSISGDSRGYLRRNGVEVPARIASRLAVACGYGRR